MFLNFGSINFGGGNDPPSGSKGKLLVLAAVFVLLVCALAWRLGILNIPEIAIRLEPVKHSETF